VKNLLPLLKKMKKIEGGSKFFSFRFSLLPFFITFAGENKKQQEIWTITRRIVTNVRPGDSEQGC